jgi:hypothetical protein
MEKLRKALTRQKGQNALILKARSHMRYALKVAMDVVRICRTTKLVSTQTKLMKALRTSCTQTHKDWAPAPEVVPWPHDPVVLQQGGHGERGHRPIGQHARQCERHA